MKISSLRAELLHANEGTDRQMYRHDEANNHFSQLCEHG